MGWLRCLRLLWRIGGERMAMMSGMLGMVMMDRGDGMDG